MAQTQIKNAQSGEKHDSQDWQQISARVTRLEDKIEVLPCQEDLKNFVTYDNLKKSIKPLASKYDLEVEIGMVTDSMLKKQDLDKFATLEDLNKVSEEVARLSKEVAKLSGEVGKCAKQEDLDNLAAEVNKLSKAVEKCAKQEELDKLSEEVTKLSAEVTSLSEKVIKQSEESKNYATKEDIKNLKDDIKESLSFVHSRQSQTNFGILIATVFFTLVYMLGGPQNVVGKASEIFMSIISMVS